MKARSHLLGLTGSIGMGKSTTAGFFADAGIPVWDADAAVHRIYGPGGAGADALRDIAPGAAKGGIVDRDTLRAAIDYALAEAITPYGIIGIKVWIFKGEIMEHDPSARDRKTQELQDGPAPRGAMGGGRR